MSIFPTYTSPPDIGWVSALWADDAKNRSHPNNPNASIEKIQATYGGNVLGLTLGSSRPHFITQSQYLGNRGAWVADSIADGIWGYLGDKGQQMTLVVVGAYTAVPSAGLPHMAYTGNIALSNSGGGVRVAGSNNDSFPYVRLPINTPLLYTAYTNRPTTANVRSSLNGNQFTKGQLNNALTSSTIGLGTTASGGNSGFWHIGFFGTYQGDATTSPYWSDFLDWVQSHYGFDPRSTYDTSSPPPIDWKAEYLADDFNASTGVWPDRTDRGFSLTTPSGNTSNVPGIVAASGNTPAGWKSGYDAASIAKTPYTSTSIASLAGSRNLEFIARITGASPSTATINIASICGGFAASRQWDWAVGSSAITFMWNDVTNGNGVSTSVPFPSDLLGKPIWLRMTQVISGGQTTHTYYVNTGDSSSPPSTWTQLGTPQVVAYAANFVNQGYSLLFGAQGPWTLPGPSGQVIHRIIINNGIGGAAIVDADFSAQTPGTTTSFVDGAGNTILLNQTLPIKVNNVINGQPVVRFDGIDDYLKASSVGLVAPLSVVAVARARGTVTNPTFVGSENSVGRAIAGDTVTPAWQTRLVNQNNVSAGGTSPSNWNLIRMYDNGSTGGVFAVNETVLASGLTIGAAGITDLVLASQQGGVSGFSDVDIAYVAIFSGDVTQSTLWSTFKTWVTSKYGITVA